MTESPGRRCGSCGAELPPRVLTCPSCGERVHSLRTRPQENPSQAAAPTGAKKALRTGGILAILLKLAAKFKFILLGLSKLSTLSSMFLTAWAYSGGNGWPFALGLVASIYIHEMGHVQALAGYGVKATAPVFIPFVGAFIRVQQRFASNAQNARVGLAGPLWGFGAALILEALGQALNWPLGLSLARVGAYINLFNLIPVWQLDGSRALSALSRGQRWVLLLAVGLTELATGAVWLPWIAIPLLFRTLFGRSPEEGDRYVLGLYAFLTFALSFLATRPFETLVQ